MPLSDLVSIDPCTGREIWRGSIDDPSPAIAAARDASRGWANTPLEDRIGIANRFAAVVTDRAEEFARLISNETGKPLWESRTEVTSVTAKIAISIAAQAERAGIRVNESSGLRQALRHKPHGVLGVLGPYNFPAHLPNGHIAPALLAGNAVVFKPSEQTPASGEFMARCWADAGLPDGVLGVVQGGREIGRALAQNPGLDGLLFTGSATAGSALAALYAQTPGRILALEMGGNNPLVVWNADDLDAAAGIVVQSAYLSAGQRCTNARRLIVHEDQADALVERVLGLIDRLIVGAPFDDPEPFMGPVIDLSTSDRLLQAAAAMEAAGARTIAPLARIVPDRPFLAPGLIDVTGIAVDDDELFGPLLQLIRVPDFAAAMRAANDTAFGLAAGLIGGDEALYRQFWTESRAGVVNWNRPTNGASSSAPFGGIGSSGNHRPSAYYAADYAAWPVASLEADTLSPIAFKGVRQA